MVKMAEERYTFAQARARLEDIVVQVRKKDTSLEKSLDLLEEGVRLANACTELSDHTEWRSVAENREADVSDDSQAQDAPEGDASVADDAHGDAPAVDRAEAELDRFDGEDPAGGDDDCEASDITQVAQDIDDADQILHEQAESDR
ncbi:MAG: exodeoxyribonuclease VII small subunit [Coriobacteriia bacterium]